MRNQPQAKQAWATLKKVGPRLDSGLALLLPPGKPQVAAAVAGSLLPTRGDWRSSWFPGIAQGAAGGRVRLSLSSTYRERKEEGQVNPEVNTLTLVGKRSSELKWGEVIKEEKDKK